jgi:hypothetical protein
VRSGVSAGNAGEGWSLIGISHFAEGGRAVRAVFVLRVDPNRRIGAPASSRCGVAVCPVAAASDGDANIGGVTPYPRWRFFPAFQAPPAWVQPLVGIFANNRERIDSLVVHDDPMVSNDVLRVISDDLENDMRFIVERGKTKLGKLPRPVFFGDEGTYLRTYEIDAFHPDLGIALEVEAGRATLGNAVYRDLIQGSLMVEARFLALAVPVEYRYRSGGRTSREPSYSKTYSVVEAIYGSERLSLPFDGLLLIGY